LGKQVGTPFAWLTVRKVQRVAVRSATELNKAEVLGGFDVVERGSASLVRDVVPSFLVNGEMGRNRECWVTALA
jgi:hypothetical protein